MDVIICSAVESDVGDEDIELIELTVGGAVGISVVISVDGIKEMEGLRDGRHVGPFVDEGGNEGALESVGAMEDVGDIVGP